MFTLDHAGLLNAVFSADGSLVLTRSDTFQTAKMWNAINGEMLHAWNASEFAIMSSALFITLVCNKAETTELGSDLSEIDMLEKILLESESTPCLEQQDHLHQAILKSRLSEELDSFSIAGRISSSHVHNGTSSSGGSADDPTSVISVAGSQPCCYAHGTYFFTNKGEPKAIEDITQGDVLVSADGSDVEVRSNIRHSSMDRELVLLQTDAFTIALTLNHRVVILRGGSRQTIPAGHLRVGDSVLSGSGEKNIICMNHFFSDMEVYEVVLDPDLPIKTFFIGDNEHGALLTKGKRASERNRGYIRKRCA
jgi:hypothetical protein